MSINMCQHPACQVNVSRKGVLCAPDSMVLAQKPFHLLGVCGYSPGVHSMNIRAVGGAELQNLDYFYTLLQCKTINIPTRDQL